VKLRVFARHDLIRRRPKGEKPAVLLEGSWDTATTSPVHEALDDAIDGRFDWIDRLAADWAETAAEADRSGRDDGSLPLGISAAYLNALGLRYYLVKLLRVATYFTELRPLRAGRCVELTAAAGRDDDYGQLISQLCLAAGACCRIRWIVTRPTRDDFFPPLALWRRCLERISRVWQPVAQRSTARPRVVLCGNPRLLAPVCRELLERRCQVWWLYDRFAVKSWFRWQAAGVGQLVCNTSLGRTNAFRSPPAAIVPADGFHFRGVDLAASLTNWLARRVTTHGRQQTRMIERIDAHFRNVRPDVLVLDEDATPLARAAVAIGRRHGVRSLVVQHGVPCCRFGFAPLAADRILVWGRSSQRRLIDWGVPPERITITGSPQQPSPPAPLPEEEGRLRLRSTGVRSDGEARFDGENEVRIPSLPPRILLLATVAPRDQRPDAVALHLTGRTYAEMLRLAFRVVAGIDGVELIVKLHPRTTDDPVVRSLQAELPGLRSRVVRRGSLAPWLDGIDCVLSCGSSAGVEATLWGLPVIQLVPPRATGFPPHEHWGMTGTAHDEKGLQEHLARVLVERWRPVPGPDPHVFADWGRPATARIAEEVLHSARLLRQSQPPAVGTRSPFDLARDDVTC